MKKTFLALALVAGFTASQAATADSKFAIGVYGGTTGVGVGTTYNFNDNINFRAIANRMDYSKDFSVDYFDYDLNLGMNSVEALVDYFPFDSGFRMTGGFMANNNDISGRGKPNSAGLVEFGGEVFSTTDLSSVDAKVEMNRFMPYLGLGYGNTFKGSPFSFSADAGVFFMGKPESSIRAVTADGADPALQVLLAEAAKNEERKLDDEVKRLRYYPLVRIGLTYAF